MATQPWSKLDKRTARRRPASHRDCGYSFIEMVITLALMGVVVIGILTTTRAAVTASAFSRERGQVETALLNASDRVTRAPLKCVIGGYQEYIDAAIASWQGQGSASVTVSHYEYDATSGAFAPGSWNASAPCPADVTRSKVQRIEITITGPDGRVTRATEVVKGNV